MLRNQWANPFFYFSFKQFYKIWFSPSPDSFLGLENELRFIRMRNMHPQAVIYFIYSSACLLKDTIEKLKKFCITQQIIPIDFDTDIPALLKTEKEKKVYTIAKEEIKNAINGTGGNLAAASDCVRSLTCVVQEYGIYSDFDVNFNLSGFTNELQRLNAPVLLNFEEVSFLSGRVLSCNSDFLAYSIEQDKKQTLSAAAQQALENIQDTIIANYSRSVPVSIIYTCNQTHGLCPELALANKHYEAIFAAITQGKTLDIFAYRQACLAYFPKISTNNIMKKFIFNNTVLAMTGPSIYGNLYKHHLTPPLTPVSYFDPHDSIWNDYRLIYRKSAVNSYPALAKAIQLTNVTSKPANITTEPNSDESWTQEGANAKEKRQQSMVLAGRKIHSLWRKPATAHNILVSRAKSFCNANLYDLLKNKEYALVLRKACAVANLPLVLLLLNFRHRLNIELNATSKNGNTALDWAMEASDQPCQVEMCEALIKAGAKSGKAVAMNAK